MATTTTDNPSRAAIIESRFMQPGDQDEFDVWRRVAEAWGDPGDHTDALETMMVERRAFLNTPALANAGKPVSCGSACFVLPIEDSLTKGDAAIGRTLLDATAVHQFGGGTGFSFGRIRPKGSLVSTTGREAPGPVSFLHGYSDWFKRVSQAGLRPAANMAILPVDHPDVMDFITCKEREGDIPNFNISVAATDAFMRAVKSRFRYDGSLYTGQVDGDPEDVWDAIVEGAWRNGEPGLFFIDTTNRAALHPERIEATNPCGEVPLRPYEACVLGSVNLAAHLSGSPYYAIDLDALEDTVRTLVRALDNVIERQDYPLEIIEKEQKRYRKIGVGVMGYADVLTLKGIHYGSPDALQLARVAMEHIQKISYDESHKLAHERGCYVGYLGEMGSAFKTPRAPVAGQPDLPFRRNLCCQVIAPTGTLARLAGCSWGIEPHYAKAMDSFILGQQFYDRNPLADHPNFLTYEDVTGEAHVRTQAAFQEFTDQAVSKTVNLPHSATRQEVAGIYKLAWELGCKGITVLREHSRQDVVIRPDCKDGVCAM